MGWQSLIGWELVVFGGSWLAAVRWLGERAAPTMAALPGALQALIGEPELAAVWHATPYAPGVLAIVMGAYWLWRARHHGRTLAQQVAEMGAARH
jgi:hypothetical protein